MIRVLDSAGSTLMEWGRQQQQHHNPDGDDDDHNPDGDDDLNLHCDEDCHDLDCDNDVPVCLMCSRRRLVLVPGAQVLLCCLSVM